MVDLINVDALLDAQLWLRVFLVVEWCIRIGMLIVVPFRRSPEAAKGWLLLIFFEPVLGYLAYLAIGRRRIPAWRRERVRAFNELARPTAERLLAHRDIHHPTPSPEFAPAVRLAATLGEMPILGGNAVEILADYDAIVDRLVGDIDAARTDVHLLFYIFADDVVGRRVVAALERAEARGVTTRVLADALGSRTFGFEPMLPRLAAAGIEAAETLRVGFFRRHTARMDLRNHRKIAVIDGHIGYTGSLNIVDPTFKPGLTYEELMVRVEGPIALELQAVFAADWYLETGRLIGGDTAFPDPAARGDVPAQVLPSSPLYLRENNQRLIVALVYAATRRVVITTPYFIPDDPLLQALTSAVLRGVDVRLVVPGQDDQLLVSSAQKSYYGELLNAGVKICRYSRRFLHAKHATIDDHVAWVGSSNMDIRSFALNAEITLLVYDRGVCERLQVEQERYFREGEWLDANAWAAQPLYRQVGWNLARLFSPLL
jgi:cardiolipin synthase